MLMPSSPLTASVNFGGMSIFEYSRAPASEMSVTLMLRGDLPLMSVPFISLSERRSSAGPLCHLN